MHLEHLLDSYAYRGRLSACSPDLKLLLAASALGVTVMAPSPVAPVMVLLVMGGAVLLSGVPAGVYAKAMMGPVFFSLPILLLIPFMAGGEAPLMAVEVFSLEFTATREGTNLALLLAIRALAGSATLFFVIFTTPMAVVFSAMRRLRLPPLFVEMCMLIYRFLFVIADEAERMLHAQRVRLGYTSMRRGIDSFALLASNLLLRSYLRAERVTSALEARGYTGSVEFPDVESNKSGAGGMALAALFVTILAAIAYLTADVEVV